MSIYKASDIRGVVFNELDMEIAEKIGTVFANIIQEENNREDITILTAQDMRPSGVELIKALHRGINQAGANIMHIGLATTPMFYYAVGLNKTDGGITCTASHNPAQYNGFKLVRKNSIPVSDVTGIKEIERRISENEIKYSSKTGKVEHCKIFQQYIQKILSFAKDTNKKLKVAIDTANGMGGIYNKIFLELGFDVVPLFFELDGTFPNHEANPLKFKTLKKLQKKIIEEKADFGAAFDGDADRIIFLDEKAQIIPADLTTAFIAAKIVADKPGSSIVFDVRSSRIVAEIIKKLNCIPLRNRTGHSFIKDRMRQENSIFAGELSGHYYWKDMFTSDSAILALVFVANIMRETGKPLSKQLLPMQKYFQSGEINFTIKNMNGTMKKLEEIFHDGEIDWVDGITVQYETWWFNVRPSNTEPLLRLNLEANTQLELNQRVEQLKNILNTMSS